jgi:hypothetical protein
LKFFAEAVVKKKLLNFFGKLEKNATYSRANAKVIITLLFSLVFFYQFQDKINQVPDLSYSIIHNCFIA